MKMQTIKHLNKQNPKPYTSKQTINKLLQIATWWRGEEHPEERQEEREEKMWTTSK